MLDILFGLGVAALILAGLALVCYLVVQIGLQLITGYDDGYFDGTKYGYGNDHPNPVYAWLYDVGWWLGVKAAEREERVDETREERLEYRRAKHWRAGDRND